MVKKAFTLAEVLIVLGIIGVVASLTIPTIINSYKSKQLKTRLNKTYATLSQAVEMLQAETGVPVTILQYASGGQQTFYKDLKKHLKVAKDCALEDCVAWNRENEDINYVVDNYRTYDLSGNIVTRYFDDGQLILQDGTLIMFENPQGGHIILISADINGLENGPNAWGHDLFSFQLYDNKLVPSGSLGTSYSYAVHPQYCNKFTYNEINGIGCTYKALTEPDYFKNLPK